jgi:hypothetical protein
VTNWLRLVPAAPNCVPRANDCGVTPADNAANDSRLRPATGRSSICFCEIVCPTDALVVCSSGDMPTTVTFSEMLARPSATVGLAISPFRSVRSRISAVWNPDSSTRIE